METMAIDKFPNGAPFLMASSILLISYSIFLKPTKKKTFLRNKFSKR